jgi:flagellar M-ring protein FliF
MDFITRNYQSLLALLRSMTPAAQISSVLMLVAIGASMFYLFQYQLNGGTTYLFGGQEFSQGEIGHMETALSQEGLNQYEVVGNRIRVPLSSRDKYLKAIADGSAVPASIIRKESAIGSNPFASSTERQQHIKAANIKTIEDMIRQSSKIASATVHYDERMEGAPFREARITCVATIRPIGSHQLSRDEVIGIQNVIRSSLAGIKDKDITIFDANNGQSFTGDMFAMDAAESELIRNKKWWEDEYRKKISAQLLAYPGATVGVEVELDPTLGTNTYQRTLETPVTLEQNAERTTTRSSTGGNGGAPGTRTNLPANAAANTQASLGESRQSSTDITKENSSAIVGGGITHTQQAGLNVKRAKVSVGVPQKTVEKLFAAANPAPDGAAIAIEPSKLQEYFLQNIRQPISEKVRALIQQGSTVGQDPFEDIVVLMDPSFEMDAIPATPMTETALSWLAANWQNLGLFGFGLFSLVMLRSMVNTASKNDGAVARAEYELNRILPPDEASDEAEEIIVGKDGSTRIVKRKKPVESIEEREARENQLKKRFQNRQPNIREELAELVEADLDAAASVLKAWIGEPTS